MYQNTFVIFCKTYKKDFKRFKILKASIDKFNVENIPFYISCPESDRELFLSLKTGNENYNYKVLSDKEILNSNILEQNWISQQYVKMGFAYTNIAKFYLIIDSDSYFIKDFHINDFLFDENTPYIVMHEGKYFREVCSIINDKNIFEMAKIIKDYFKRQGKDYQFLTTPIIFVSEAIKELNKFGDIKTLLSISPLEAYWHGEFLLYSNIIPFKPCEPFFKCFNYQFEYNFWRKNGELESDIAKNYLGIVMQNRWVKSSIFKNSFSTYFFKKIIRLRHFINTDRAHLKHNFKFYKHLAKNFIKEIFKGVR